MQGLSVVETGGVGQYGSFGNTLAELTYEEVLVQINRNGVMLLSLIT